MSYCVALFEFAHPGERLDASQQLNEVFGPFDLESDADAFAERARHLIKDRHWLITPMSDPSVLNSLDTRIN